MIIAFEIVENIMLGIINKQSVINELKDVSRDIVRLLYYLTNNYVSYNLVSQNELIIHSVFYDKNQAYDSLDNVLFAKKLGEDYGKDIEIYEM